MSPLISICWIILSMPESKPSTESDSYKTFFGICVANSCLFRSMEHIYDKNRLIQLMRTKLDCLLVMSSNWLYWASIAQDNLHLQLCCDQCIQLFLLRSNNCPTKISHAFIEIPWIRIQDYTMMASKLLQNSNISSIIIMLPKIKILSPMKNPSISVTVTCSLTRVTKL